MRVVGHLAIEEALLGGVRSPLDSWARLAPLAFRLGYLAFAEKTPNLYIEGSCDLFDGDQT
jgi:hypothetical protein